MPITRRVKPIHIFPGSTQQFSKYAVQPTGWLSARNCTMPKAILEHILEGPIASDSVEAFGSVVKEFPEDPELLKLFADFLTAKGKGPFAAQHYSKASELFLSSGRRLHAVVAKMLEWRIE